MDEHLKETLVSTEKIYSGTIVNLRRDVVCLPNGKTASREVVEHPGAVAIVPVLSDGRILLVRQFRHPVGRVLLEIPAGKLTAGEEPDECAARELEEETGYQAKTLERRISLFTGPGFTDEVIHMYLAHDLVQTLANPDEDEFLEVSAYEMGEIQLMLRAGLICDAKTIAGIYLLQDAK